MKSNSTLITDELTPTNDKATELSTGTSSVSSELLSENQEVSDSLSESTSDSLSSQESSLPEEIGDESSVSDVIQPEPDVTTVSEERLSESIDPTEATEPIETNVTIGEESVELEYKAEESQNLNKTEEILSVDNLHETDKKDVEIPSDIIEGVPQEKPESELLVENEVSPSAEILSVDNSNSAHIEDVEIPSDAVDGVPQEKPESVLPTENEVAPTDEILSVDHSNQADSKEVEIPSYEVVTVDKDKPDSELQVENNSETTTEVLEEADKQTAIVVESPVVDESPVVENLSEPSTSEAELLVVEDHEMEEMEKEDAEIAQEDYSGLDKEQLVKVAEQLNRESDPLLANRAIQKIKPLFDALYTHDKAEALEKYIADGGVSETFEYKHSNMDVRFHQAQKGIYEKRKLNQEFQQKERAKNLEAKLTILDQLRQLVDDHEHTPGYDKFKVIREEWKKIGPVGPEHAQNLNASYYSLIERFYSLSEIYHNLRDFDRKKNLDLKLELIAKIEKLAEEPMISKAMKDLMNYQDEYRSLGPVPKDRLEEIKDRLKKGVDVVYDRRRVFNEDRKKLMNEEIALKEVLLQKIAEFETYVAENAKDWQMKTKDLLQLQDEWKAIPGRFREKTIDLNKHFWTIFKKFMNAKNDFFRQLEKGKKDVLASKQALVDEVESLKTGDDWDGIANRMKQLQGEWRQIAPVFGKEGQKVYDAFKAGIDHFFTRLREQRTGEDKVQFENLSAKESICAEIEALADSGKGNRKKLDELRDQFRNVGFVPMKSIQKINGRFSKAMMDLIDSSSEIHENDKEKLKINLLSNRSTYSTEGVKTLKNQEGYIQKRLQQLRKDVGNLEDNISMFKMSKNAMAMIEDVQKRINLSKLEIKELESQLKEIRTSERNG